MRNKAQHCIESELVTEFRPRLLRLLNRLVRNESTSEDLAHETLVIVITRLREGTILQPERLAGFVYGTARYVYLGWVRNHNNRLELRESVDDTADERSDPEDGLYYRRMSENLKQFIGRLRVERDRDILVRSYLYEQSKDEICHALELAPNTFDTVISRARTRLREKVS